MKHSTLEAAYLFYYASDIVFSLGAEEDGRLKKRLQELVEDALIVADQVITLTLFPELFYRKFVTNHRQNSMSSTLLLLWITSISYTILRYHA
jgi:Myristoyl-CoA:protein N-myristoyltransferase, C-terminal domain